MGETVTTRDESTQFTAPLRLAPAWASSVTDQDGGHDGPYGYVGRSVGVLSAWHPTAGAEIWLDVYEGAVYTPAQAYQLGMELLRVAFLTADGQPGVLAPAS